MKTLSLTIRTPEKTIYSGQAQFVKFFSEQGLMKVFPNHSSLTAAINFSPLIFVDEKGTEEDLVMRRGTAMISNSKNAIDIMVFECEYKAELCPTTAKDYLKFIEEELAKGTDLSDFKISFLEEEKYVIEKQIQHMGSDEKLVS